MDYVYKYVLNDQILYIGKSSAPAFARLKQHGKAGDNIPEEAWLELAKSTIYYAEVANKTMADVVESELIRRHKPKYNRAKTSDWAGLKFVEPEWVMFKGEKYDVEKASVKRSRTVPEKVQQEIYWDFTRQTIEFGIDVMALSQYIESKEGKKFYHRNGEMILEDIHGKTEVLKVVANSGSE